MHDDDDGTPEYSCNTSYVYEETSPASVCLPKLMLVASAADDDDDDGVGRGRKI